MRTTRKINTSHAPFLQSGRIENEHMLYTLAVLANEPIKWINRFERRQLTMAELHALGVFWKTVGEGLMIESVPLLTSVTGKVDSNGRDWLESLDHWSKDYERRKQAFDVSNQRLVHMLEDNISRRLPVYIRVLGVRGPSILADTKLRACLGLPPRSEVMYKLFISVFFVPKVLLRAF